MVLVPVKISEAVKITDMILFPAYHLDLVDRHSEKPTVCYCHTNQVFVLLTSKSWSPKFPHANTMKMNFLKIYKEAIYKNIFIALKLKINEGNLSQAICMSAIPLSKKMHCPASIPHRGRLYFFYWSGWTELFSDPISYWY